MKLIKHERDENGVYKHELHIDELEAALVQLDKRDKYLLDECNKSSKISDHLLALGMVARRIEEQEKNK